MELMLGGSSNKEQIPVDYQPKCYIPTYLPTGSQNIQRTSFLEYDYGFQRYESAKEPPVLCWFLHETRRFFTLESVLHMHSQTLQFWFWWRFNFIGFVAIKGLELAYLCPCA
jgi:hypothetical protein